MVGGVAAVAHHAGRTSAQLQDAQQQQAAQAAPEPAAAPPPPPPAPAAPAAPEASVPEQLTQLKSLLDAGALTQEEFDTEKQKILAQG
jgi:hypothetical protein